MFSGSIVAIVTPFKSGKVDEETFRQLIEYQIENGTRAIVPCGTTGESATLSVEEHTRVIDIAIEAVNKRVPVIAGTGGNSTHEAVELTRHAEKAGAEVADFEYGEALRALLRHAADLLRSSPKETKLYRALYHTYFQPAPTQEAAAEALDLPFSTYRRHLKSGITRIVEILWQWEIGGTDK